MDRIKRYFPDLMPRQIEQFEALKPLYEDWNSKINVISRKDMDNFYEHHVLHSLAIGKLFRPSEGAEILDLGTGGGFPGVPLSILYPQAHFTLCDSIGKKIKVATEVASSLGLSNVTTVNARAETLGKDFDWVVSRAVTALDNFLPWIKGRYTKGILYLKGGDIEQEIDASISKRLLGPKLLTVVDIKTLFEGEWFEEKKIVMINR
jgi:16S rRNA (guanine527-N7)-methyltransferase